nr:site-specific DNA-methyltransferase [uncultured Desulfobacter sp.]
MEKLKMHSPNFVEENIAKLAALFPGCVTESTDEEGNHKKAIDFDMLRQELSTAIVEGPQERYNLNWPGKREALLTANAPIAKTFRPCQEESVDFDTTRNIFIEGDNLDALKLLQENYLSKVKMIYIDPPYNTGNDFVYDDHFAESTGDFLRRSNQEDEERNRLVANPDSNGRFHSAWLSMMYPRLKLARNLLKEDGVIFISIDDGEQANLKRICDEIFGGQNFVANSVWQKAYVANMTARHISNTHDHVLIYSKNYLKLKLGRFPRTEEQIAKFKNPDNDARGPWKAENLSAGKFYAAGQFEIITPNGLAVKPPPGRYWRCNKDTYKKWLKDGRISFGKNGEGRPMLKKYLSEVQDGLTPETWWIHSAFGSNKEASIQLKKMFDGKQFFETPKPMTLLKRIIQLCDDKQGIFLDFFAGSATTAHATIQLNSEDAGKRKFIMIQLPEICDEKSEAFKAGYKTIAEISKERIRRAGKKIKEENPTTASDLDTGFRVLKIDSSNMADVYYTPDSVEQNLLTLQTDNIKEDRTSEDLLFQVLLDWGVDLTLPITKETIEDREVLFVDSNALAACFEKDGKITEDFCKKLAEYQPLRVVFRDSGFKDDSVKINVEQIFKLMSPHTDVKTI